MTYYCKLLCIVLFVILLGGGKSQAQSKGCGVPGLYSSGGGFT